MFWLRAKCSPRRERARERAVDHHHGDRSRDPRPFARRILPPRNDGAVACRSCGPRTAAGTRAKISTSACARFSFSTPSIVFICHAQGRRGGQALIPFSGYEKLLTGATKRRSAFFSRPKTRRPERRPFQRAGCRISRARVSDAGRSGAAQRALGARQPVDVSHRASCGLSVAHASGVARSAANGEPFPILHESTPVRMDLSHSGWSDIFFLGMDLPEGAGAECFHRSGGAGARCADAEAAGRSLFARDRSAGDASGERGSGGERRDRRSAGAIRFWPRLSWVVQGGGHRFRNGAARHGRLGPAACVDLLAQLIGREGLGHRNSQPGERYSQGFAAGRFHNLLASLIAVCMRATSQDSIAHGNWRSGPAAGGGTRDSRRVARRVRRRLAGFGRCVAGHQTD